MTQLSFIALAVLGGALAGLLFFGGLWWTVQRIPYVKRPVVLTLSSLLLRLALTMVVFYTIMAVTGHVLYLGLALAVFIAVRVFMAGQVRGKRHAIEP